MAVPQYEPIYSEHFKHGALEVEIELVLVPPQDVEKYGDSRFNSSNHPPKPSDYYEKLESTKMSNWVDLFHGSYKTMTLDKRDISWMLEAAKVGAVTGSVSSLNKEDIEWTISRHREDDVFDGDEYFVRTESTSLKYGFHKAGPYKNMKQVIESLISSTSVHSPLPREAEPCKLYFLPWIPSLKLDAEFRIFVQEKRVIAVSQQASQRPNRILSQFEDHRRIAIEWMKSAISFSHDEVIPKLKNENYTIDLALIPVNADGDFSKVKPYFIEINGFGANYSAGSSLFHWLIDDQQLSGSRYPIVQFRYSL
jgi:hypothetical protein